MKDHPAISEESPRDVQAFLREVVRTISKDPEKIAVRASRSGEVTTLLLQTSSRDREVLLEGSARTFRSLQVIVRAFGVRTGQQLQLDLLESVE